MLRTKLNQHGFTLYTALLSFILILLAGLLVNTMINSERVSNQVIQQVEAQSRMQSLADLTRADALQVVNYGIRNAIEEYTQDEGNAYLYPQQTTTWTQVITDFSNFFFGAQNGGTIAGRIAANLHVIVQSGPRRIAGYTITIQGGDETDLKAAIENVFGETLASGQSFVQVVKCTETTPPVECVGTFYVNLDFSKISDTEYEKLPSIHVKDEATGRELVEPVIPRGKFRIYVPLRIFRALKYAHLVAQGTLAQGGGILSPEFHSHLGELGVGMCDGVNEAGAVNCGIRTQPFTPAQPPNIGPVSYQSGGPNGGGLCPSENLPPVVENEAPHNVPLTCDSIAASLGLCTQGQLITTYNPGVASSRSAALNTLVQQFTTQQVTVTLSNIQQSPDFTLLTNQLTIQPTPVGIPTKDIVYEGLLGVPGSQAICTKLAGTNVTLRFEEENLNYVVVDSRAPLHYSVRIVDSFAATTTRTECVSYCLVDSIGGTFIYGPDFSQGINVCDKTACDVRDAGYVSLCGNGQIDSTPFGEQCDIASSEPNNGCEPNLVCTTQCLCRPVIADEPPTPSP